MALVASEPVYTTVADKITSQRESSEVCKFEADCGIAENC